MDKLYEINNAFHLDTENIEDEILPTIDCKYYNMMISAQRNLAQPRTFSVLHYNMHSIEHHIEEFCVTLLTYIYFARTIQ